MSDVDFFQNSRTTILLWLMILQDINDRRWAGFCASQKPHVLLGRSELLNELLQLGDQLSSKRKKQQTNTTRNTNEALEWEKQCLMLGQTPFLNIISSNLTYRKLMMCYHEIILLHPPPDYFPSPLHLNVCTNTGEVMSNIKPLILLKSNNCSCKHINNEKAWTHILVWTARLHWSPSRDPIRNIYLKRTTNVRVI